MFNTIFTFIMAISRRVIFPDGWYEYVSDAYKRATRLRRSGGNSRATHYPGELGGRVAGDSRGDGAKSLLRNGCGFLHRFFQLEQAPSGRWSSGTGRLLTETARCMFTGDPYSLDPTCTYGMSLSMPSLPRWTGSFEVLKNCVTLEQGYKKHILDQSLPSVKK